jgi:hypothetical protein
MPFSPRCSAPRQGARRTRVAAVEVDELRRVRAREQQAGLLEAFADRGDVVVEAAARQAETPARFGVVEAGDGRVRQRVVLLDDAAGKDPGAAVVVAALGAPRQQHLDALGAVADDDDRRRRPRRSLDRGGAGAGKAEASTGAAGMACGEKGGVVEFGTASKTRPASERSDSRCDANPTSAQRFSLSLRRRGPVMMSASFLPRRGALSGVQPCFTMPLCSS